MKAVRRIRPDARLVQTEDIGHTYGTPPLQYQVDFDNGRRWLSLDLLMGMVDRNHQFWSYLLEHGASEDELVSFLEEPCRPDIIGANYYVTSERFLDHRIDRYPAGVVGGNGHQQYADVCAVRVRKKGIAGAYGILRQVWDRYRREVAMTECHLGCTRDEQIRWLLEAWNAAHCLARENIPVRAVTAWSLFGAYDWDSLLTRFTGNYEPGAFDLRAPKPRPTALAQCVRELATNGRFLHPLLASPGWWRRSQRVLYPVVQERARNHAPVFESTQSQPAPPLLITGASGTLGRAFARICEVRGLAFQLLSRQQMDIADPHSVEEAIRQLRPWAVINAAGYVKVDQAEEQPEACFRENALGPAILARFCHKAGARLVTFSSDLVFDGRRDKPYLESTATNPLNVYGQSKVEAERAVLEASDRALIVRTSAFFGPWDDYNFVCHVREKLRRGETVVAADDVIISPTYVPDLVNNTLDLLIDGETGIWHLANAGGLSWAEWAGLVTDAYGAPRSLVEPVNRDRLSLAAARPAYSVIGSERGWIMPAFTSAMERFVGERQEYENKVQVSPQCGDQRGSRVDRKASRRAA
jgi:dTDP-4-dehydrorhamnose reductase